MKRNQAWFSEWREDTKEYSSKTPSKGNPFFLSPETYVNLRLRICGFFAFAEMTLKIESVAYVPMLYSNTSEIEASFSDIKGRVGRDALTFKTQVAYRSTHRSIDQLRKTAYDIGTTEVPLAS